MRRSGSCWLVSIAALFMLVGCFDKEEDTCTYWVPKVMQPAFTDRAVDKVAEMGCHQALGDLQTLFDDGQFQTRILRTVKQIGDKEGGAGILRKGLLLGSTSKLSASIVKDWRLAAAKPELDTILTTQNLPKSRLVALDALLSFARPATVEELLIKLAADDPNLQGIDVNRRAVEELGKLRSVRAIPTVIRALFVSDQVGKSIYQSARQALAQIGSAAIDPIIALAQKKDAEFIKWSVEQGLLEWQWRKGPELTQVLVDTLDPRAAKEVVALMALPIAPPLGVSEQMKEKWRTAQINRFTVSMTGLGSMAQLTALDGLLGMVRDPMADMVNQRMKSASALALIGSKAAQVGLLEIFEHKDTKEIFKPPFLQPLTQALDFDHLPRFDKAVKKPSARVKAGLASAKVAGYLAVVRACKNDANCYIQKLKSENRHEAIKAAVMLGRGIGDDATVRKALIRAFLDAPRRDADLHRFPLVALLRRGSPEFGDELLKISRNMGRGEEYWQNELSAYGNWLKTKAPAGK
ncbi:MAG: HEAT repeat domain-containing protein [Myxococcota bacterium]|nr:HEAT repeat domain-containing protein [Myxococcota bacterium]